MQRAWRQIIPVVRVAMHAFHSRSRFASRRPISRAGGKHLYDPYHTNDPTVWKHPEDGNIEYVTKFMSDSHSLSIFEIEGKALTLKQVDQYGGTIDAIRVTKA